MIRGIFAFVSRVPEVEETVHRTAAAVAVPHYLHVHRARRGHGVAATRLAALPVAARVPRHARRKSTMMRAMQDRDQGRPHLCKEGLV